MEWSFIAGLVTGSVLSALFSIWLAVHDLKVKR